MISKWTSYATVLLLAAGLVTFNSCKHKAKTETTTNPATNETSATTATAQNTDASARYAVTFTPDSVTIGKKNEMFIKFTESDAVDLSDPDGKSTGMKVTINFLLTNKNAIGGSGIFLNSGNQRLALDNGSSVSVSGGSSDVAEPESSKAGSLIFTVPAGAKPAKLNLFEDETRSAVQIVLTKK